MDKPISMSVKDFLIRTLAVKMLTSEKTLEAVVNHQFQSANEAMDTNNSVEISGFGKFMFNGKKALTRLEKLNAKKIALTRIIEDPATSVTKHNSSIVTLNDTDRSITTLKARINED